MKKIFKKIAVSLAIIFMLVFANGCYYVFHGQFKSVEKLNQGKELNLYECCSIYTMHMAVWMFGWPMSPVAAHECFTLHFPQDEEVTDFNIKRRLQILSPKIKRAIRSLSNSPIGAYTTVSWNGDEAYSTNSKERIAAIALNPCFVEKAAYMQDGSALYLVSTSTQYPKYSKTTFTVGGIKIVLHEGLFCYLQKKKWLSAHIVTYGIFEDWVRD